MHLVVRKVVAGIFLCALGALYAGSLPQPRLHAHNDYWHERPLLDALDEGICSVEADIFLVDGQLLVAHDRAKVDPGRTLQKLYLSPLRARISENNGRVFAGGPEFSLLIDLKQDWQSTYPVLREVLRSYSDILSAFSGTNKEPGAVTVLLTGNRSVEMFAGESRRYAALDGTLNDLETVPSPDMVPLISSPWYQTFKWRGTGSFPEVERVKLREIVSRAHAQGRRIRFWGAPDQPVFWRELLDSGVDLINTDRLKEASRFLLEAEPASPKR